MKPSLDRSKRGNASLREITGQAGANVGAGRSGRGAIITFEEAGDSEIGVIRIGEGRSEIVIELGAGGSFCLEDELSWFPAGGQIVVGYHGRMDETWWRDNFFGER